MSHERLANMIMSFVSVPVWFYSPGLEVEPPPHEQESGEQKPRPGPGSDPEAERED